MFHFISSLSSMPLFLQGGGSYPQTKNMDHAFFSSLLEEKPLLYIPIARICETSYDDCFRYLQGIVDDLQISLQIDMISDLSEIKEGDFSKRGGIYIGGGNTFRLLSEIKKYKIDIKLIDYLEKGGSVCGGSAGAIIFGKDIETSCDANIVALKKTHGMNLCLGYDLRCHYREKDDKQIFEYVKYHTTKVIALSEENGIFAQNGKASPIGEGQVFLFDERGKTLF